MNQHRNFRPGLLATVLFAMLFACGGVAAAVPQASAAVQSATFAPLNNWKAAVLSGNRGALAQLYSSTPPAQTKTAAGTSNDPAVEPAFWSALASQQMKNLNVKVLEVEHQNAGVVSLVLRVEFTLDRQGAQQPLLVELAQVWVKEGPDWKIALTQRSDLEPRIAERLPEPQTPNVNLYPPAEDAPGEIQNALAAASRDHKRVILVFGGNWCYDCHVLDAAFRSPKIAPIVNANYHVVHVNIGEYDKNLDLVQKYNVPIKKGVPALAILNPDGSLVFSQQQGEFESSLKLDPADVTAFLEKWKPSRH